MMRVLEVFWVFLRLGFTSFGGPVAHLAFFHNAFVEKRKWLDEETYSDTLALCQFLPGPASSQLGFAIGLMRAGLLGGFAAWTAFTLPSAAVMIGFGLGMIEYGTNPDAAWLQGLKIAVVVVVAKAVWGMARTLTPDKPRITLAIVCCIVMLALNTAWAQVAVIVLGGLTGILILRGAPQSPTAPSPGHSVRFGNAFTSALCLLLFFALLTGLPLAAQVMQDPKVDFVSGFYRGGSLVFGGGHVVLPLLQEFVVPDLMTDDTFMAGYGVAQAVPGPLFTISAYLGTVAQGENTFGGVSGGFIALIAIFLPSWLLVLGALPLWQRLRGNLVFARALRGANAAVVGILLAAFYNPVWTRGILEAEHFMIGIALFGLVQFWKLPPWASVVLAAGAGALFL